MRFILARGIAVLAILTASLSLYAAEGLFNQPHGLVVDVFGNVFVADRDNNAIRKISPDGRVTTIAGFSRTAGYADGAAATARFNRPTDVAVDENGHVFVADSGNHVIRVIDTLANTVATFAGLAGVPGSADGTGSQARFNDPQGVAFFATSITDGYVYVADTKNQTIRKISVSTGSVSTLAGLPGVAGRQNGIGSAARLNAPTCLGVDRSGDVFVAENLNQIISRYHLPLGAATTGLNLAVGVPLTPGYVDGSGTNARFYYPRDVAAIPPDLNSTYRGGIAIADTINHAIRLHYGTQVITLAGNGTAGAADGVGQAARFNTPGGIAVYGKDGTIYVADVLNHAIRRVTLGGVVTTIGGTLGVAGFADSTTCTRPLIVSGPSGTTIPAGGSATLSVSATGSTPLNYQWYQGAAGQPVGTNSPTFSTGPLTTSSVYYVQVSNACGSVTSGTASVTVQTAASVEVLGIEITQGIQNLLNSIQVIAGRRTAVRVHLRSTDGTERDVTGMLRGYRSDSSSLGEPLQPIRQPVRVKPTPDRGNLTESFTFDLPADWTAQPFEVEFVADGISVRCRDRAGVQNDCRAGAGGAYAATALIPSPPLSIRPILMPWRSLTDVTRQVYVPSFLELQQTQRTVSAMLPVREIEWKPTVRTDPLSIGGSMTENLSITTMRALAVEAAVSEDCFENPACETVYLALFSAGPRVWTSLGLSHRPTYPEGSVIPQFGRPGAAAAAILDSLTPTHELLHTFDADHITASSCPTAAGAVDLRPGDNTGRISADQNVDSDSTYFGFDTYSHLVFRPHVHDVMTYCFDGWISDETYKRALKALKYFESNSKTFSMAAATSARRMLLVQGVVQENAFPHILIDGAMYAQSGANFEPRDGSYLLSLKNESDQTVAQHSFEPDAPSDIVGVRPFSVFVPAADGVKKITIVDPTGATVTRTASLHVPSLSVVSPNGGERFDQSSHCAIEWRASDADGDALRYTVQYSGDNGQTWRTLALGIASTFYDLDLSDFERTSSARIRVIANDSFNTTQDDSDGAFTVGPAGSESCAQTPSILCLNGGRFAVSVTWRDFQNNVGSGTAVSLTNDTGYFWFFNSANVELIIKVLDGRPVNGKFWVFYGALSNVEYTISVTDTVTGQTKTYTNPLGNFASVGDTGALGISGGNGTTFELLPSSQVSRVSTPANAVTPSAVTSACGSDGQTLCLNNGRFRVTVTWRDFAGNTGAGHAVALTSDTGYFWFFADTNVELVLKVLDGRGLNGKYWVFYGALSNVSYTITVTDTVTGASRTYNNPSGNFGSLGDTTAFDGVTPVPPGSSTLLGGAFDSSSDLGYWSTTGAVLWASAPGHDGRPGKVAINGTGSIRQCVKLPAFGVARTARLWYSAPFSIVSLRVLLFDDDACMGNQPLVFQQTADNSWGESYDWQPVTVTYNACCPGSAAIEGSASYQRFPAAVYFDDASFGTTP